MTAKPPLVLPAPRELSSLELLAAVLRGEVTTDRVPAGLRALAHTRALSLLTLDPDLRGLNARSRLRLLAAVELGLRVACELATLRAPALPDPAAVAAWGTRLLALDHEELWVLALDGRNGLRAARLVASGGLHGLSVALADPVRVALRAGASAFVLVHNHPSGDPTPSAEDERFTERVAEAARIVGVPLVDHVIVARGGHESLLDRGVLGTASPSAPS
jgi:DNA repair protein RadC